VNVTLSSRGGGGVRVVLRWVEIGGAVYFLERTFWPIMQLLGLHVVVLLKCFLVVFGQQYHTHHDVADLHWKPATATWYGSPDGDGSNGKSLLYPL